jgi:hypothetical protein
MKDTGISGWREWVHSSPVAAFFLLAFLISWSTWGAARVVLPGASRELLERDLGTPQALACERAGAGAE